MDGDTERQPANNGTYQPIAIGVSCGSSHSIALLNCDVVVSWGRGEDGQLGHGDAEELQFPKTIHSLIGAGITSVHCGAEYTLAVSSTQKEVYSWGWGDFGRLGHGHTDDIFVPRPIPSLSGMVITHVACGDTHTLAVSESGKLFSFGRNQNGQLGLGHTEDCLAPMLVTALEDKCVISVDCGSEHTVIATSEGEVYGWGWGRYGNIGDGECHDRLSPIKAVGLTDITKVACGWRHSVAVSRAGKIYTWGWAKYGQLGHGDTCDRLVPTPIAMLQDSTIVLVAGGWRHTIASDEAGNVYAWGWNKFGQLGLSTTDDVHVPTRVRALAGQHLVSLSCGWRHSIAVGRTGDVYSWGRGVNGQLGHGTEDDICTPTLLEALRPGTMTRESLIAAAAPVSGYVAPADRYALVPDNQVPGFDAGVSKKSRMDDGTVPF